jgi:hypothetical protein
VAEDPDLDELIGRLRHDLPGPRLGQTGDSLLKAAVGFVSLGVPSWRPPLTPEQERKKALGCWVSILIWGGVIGFGSLGGYLYDPAPSSTRTLHLVVGAGLGVLGVMVVGLLVAIAVGITGLARRGR